MLRKRLPLFCLSGAEAQSSLGHTEEALYHTAAFPAPKRVIDAVAVWGSTYLLRHVPRARRNSNIYCSMIFLCVVCEYCAGGSHNMATSPLHPEQSQQGGRWSTPAKTWWVALLLVGNTLEYTSGTGRQREQFREHRRGSNPEGSVKPWVGRARSDHCY